MSTELNVANIFEASKGIQAKLAGWNVSAGGVNGGGRMIATDIHPIDDVSIYLNGWFEVDEEGRTFLRLTHTWYWFGRGEASEDVVQMVDLLVMVGEKAISSGLAHLGTWR